MTTAQRKRLQALERATEGQGELRVLLWESVAGLASVRDDAAALSAAGYLVVTAPKRAEGIAS